MSEKLEKMEDFFAARLAGYDDHMLSEIEGAREFYPYTASLLPREPGSRVLDLGCGTGLELEEYFALCPTARVTGIDLSQAMLDALGAKLPGKDLRLLRGSYFDLPLGEAAFDAAVSVESLHHFTAERKLALYRKLRRALRPGGVFVLTDYFAESDGHEARYFTDLERLRRQQALPSEEFYHYDTPLTLAHEQKLLQAAGFARVTLQKTWSATGTLLAETATR